VFDTGLGLADGRACFKQEFIRPAIKTCEKLFKKSNTWVDNADSFVKIEIRPGVGK
jgi:hypothetical protein